jgi:hypothetical protein
MASRPLAAAAVMIALVAWAAPSRAEPSAAEKETARSFMAEGRVRRDRNDLPGALESFRAADAIMHVPTTGLEVARTEAALGRLVEAADALRSVLHLPASPNDPPPFVAARGAAQSLLADVLARVPSIRVAPRGSKEGVRVAIDDAPLPAEAIGQAFKIDPGHHVVRVTQRGATVTREVDVAERETKLVAFDGPSDSPAGAAAVAPAPGPDPAPEPAAPAPSADAPPATSPEPSDAAPGDAPPPGAPSHPMRTIAWTGVAVAGAGVVVGSITGLLSLSHASDAKAICDGDHCPPAAASDIDAAHATGRASTIAFAVAGAGAAVALVGFLVGDRGSPPDAQAARVVPWIGPGAAGARVTF